MKFIFKRDEKGQLPYCNIEQGPSSAQFICYILNDDGGLGYDFNLEFINYGISKFIDNKEDVDPIDWSRETWTAEVKENQVEIYFNYDVNYSMIVEKQMFFAMLVKFRDFFADRNLKYLEVEI